MSSGPTNDWHYVKLRSVPSTNDFTWENKAGAAWDLTLVAEESPGVLRFDVGEDCPYYRDGYTTANLYYNSAGAEIEGPWKEMYGKSGGDSSHGGQPHNSTDWHGSDYGSWAGSDYGDYGSGSDYWSGSDYGDYGSDYGSDYGEWGDYDDYGSGSDYDYYGSDYGGFGDYDDSGSGSDYDYYGSDYGWGDYDSGSSYGDYSSDYNGWGSDYGSSDYWGSDYGSSDYWGSGSSDYWGDYGNTSPYPDMQSSPSIQQLNEMDVQEVIWAFQTMDAYHLKDLMKTNEQDVNKLMQKLSPDEKMQVMESVKHNLSGEEVCESDLGQHGNKTFCESLGCCYYMDYGRCWSDVGDGPCTGGPHRPGGSNLDSGYWSTTGWPTTPTGSYWDPEGSSWYTTTPGSDFWGPTTTWGPGSGTRPKPTGSGSGSGRRPPKLPSLKPDMPAKELTNALDELDDDTLESFLSEMDSDTQWEMYQKLNGTAYANILADYVYEDSYDESENMWDDVLGFRRRKRRETTRVKRSMVDDMLEGTMEDMGGMEDLMGLADEMEMGEKVNFMAAMGLQGVMIMDLAKFDRRNRMPKIVKELPGCVKQILWAPDKSPRGFVCSKLSKELRGNIRELIMIVLRKEIPTAPIDMAKDWMGYVEFIAKSGVEKDLLKIAMTKAASPVGADDIRELMGPIRKLYKQVLDKETDPSKKKVLGVIGGLIDAIDKDEVYEVLAAIIREIQSKFFNTSPNNNSFSRSCDLQKANANANWSPGPCSFREKSLPELCSTLTSSGGQSYHCLCLFCLISCFRRTEKGNLERR